MSPAGAFADEVARCGAAFALALGRGRFRGPIGERRGRRAGGSLEFREFRDYQPGDDLRHVDWRGFARTDQLRVRVHEEEVAPVVDVVLDTSASMATTAGKERCARGLALLLAALAANGGSRVRAFACDGTALDAAAVAFRGDGGMAAPRVPPATGGVRLVISDGLWPFAPLPAVRALAGGAARFALLQVIAAEDLRPAPADEVALVDSESGERALLRLDPGVLVAYGQRLARLCELLHGSVRSVGGIAVQVLADDLETVCRRDLLPAGLVEPA